MAKNSNFQKTSANTDKWRSLKNEIQKLEERHCRHKIIHGESIKNGRKGYLIRAFMVLDLPAHF